VDTIDQGEMGKEGEGRQREEKRRGKGMGGDRLQGHSTMFLQFNF